MEFVQSVIDLAQEHGVLWGMLILGAGAGLEYVFPPFPGDSVTIAGAMLIPTAGWPFWAVFVAVMSGSMVGGAIDWYLGLWLAKRLETGDDGWFVRWMHRDNVRARYDWVIDNFERHGTKFLAVNRFVPVFRSFFFVAAGLAGLRLRDVLFWSATSAGLWNLALMGLGYAMGYNLDRIVTFVGNYTAAVIVGFFVLLIGGKLFNMWRSRG